MTAPPYSCDKLIMAIHRVIYSWKYAEKVMNYPCSRFNVFSSTPLFFIHSNLYNNLIFPENSNNMKACSIQHYDKNRDVIGIYIYIYIVCLSQSYDVCVQPSITGWYCQCKVGDRTIDCCAHVAAVLWYLGHQRHVADTISLPTDHSRHLLNAADVDWNSDDSDIGFSLSKLSC